MAIFKNGQLSGMIGAVVAVKMKDEQIIRTVPRKRSPNGWSERQKMNWKRFGVLTDFWKQFNYTPVQKIWKLADEGKRGINLFIRTNSSAFGPAGELMDIGRLHFSAGKLSLPHMFTAVRSVTDPRKIEVTWDTHHEGGEGRGEDQLMMIAAHNGRYSELVNTGKYRKAGSAVVDLPEGMESSQAVYLSFGSQKRELYSPDQYFAV